MEYKGTIIYIGETKQVTEKFKKREFAVLDNHPDYPQKVLFQVTQDRCDLLDDMGYGQKVTITFNLRGREYEKDGKVMYFNSLEAYKIKGEGINTTNNFGESIHKPDENLPF